MTDLIEFLRSRLDEDEQVAQAVHAPADPSHVRVGSNEWRYLPSDYEVEDVDGWDVAAVRATFGPAAGIHIARHDPARVLREVEAKRRIVDECERTVLPLHRVGPYAYGQAMAILRALAAVHRDHPDYDNSWGMP